MAVQQDKELIDIAKYINKCGIKTTNSRLNDDKRIVVFKGVNFKNIINKNKEGIKDTAKTYKFDDTNLPASIARYFIEGNIMKKYEPLYEKKEESPSNIIPEYLKESKIQVNLY